MRVLNIRDVNRKDVPIYYLRLYSGLAELELLGKTIERHIEFSIEMKPTGAKEIVVQVLDQLDYPLVPVVKELRDFILSMDRSGALPC
jgi:hypothetical protein